VQFDENISARESYFRYERRGWRDKQSATGTSHTLLVTSLKVCEERNSSWHERCGSYPQTFEEHIELAIRLELIV